LDNFVYFCGGRNLNHGSCIYYALSLPTELSSRERTILFSWLLCVFKGVDEINVILFFSSKPFISIIGNSIHFFLSHSYNSHYPTHTLRGIGPKLSISCFDSSLFWANCDIFLWWTEVERWWKLTKCLNRALSSVTQLL